MRSLLTGIIFLLTGVLTFVYNHLCPDPPRELTFKRFFGMEAMGPTETAATLLGLSMLFLGGAAFQWLTQQQLLEDQETQGSTGSDEPPEHPEDAGQS